MANFEEMAMLFAISNAEDRTNYIHYEKQTRNRDIVKYPFIRLIWGGLGELSPQKL